MKKFKKILIVIPIIAILICSICVPASAIVSGDSELTLLDTSTAWIPANLTSEVFGNTMNFDSYSSVSFQMKYTGMYETNFKFNFASSHTYGVIRLLITSNSDEVSSNLVSNTNYQGVYVNGSRKTEADGWHYGHVNSYTVEIIYEGYIPSNFNVISYYNCPNPISAYMVATYEFQPIDKGTQEIINNQNANANAIQQNQNENTNKEIQADKENTQAIIDNQNQLAEQEKQEVTDSGNDSVNGAMEVMPSYDFGDVFDGFVNIMRYDGLDAKLDIPEIYIPEIPNVTKKVVLYKGGTINFKDYFDMIPNAIILVVRAVLTVALILFAFKELWTTIGQVLSGEGIKIMKNGLDGD